MQIQWCCAAGLDSAEIVSQLRAAHAHDADTNMGVDVLTGGIGDMATGGICESFKVGLPAVTYTRTDALFFPYAFHHMRLLLVATAGLHSLFYKPPIACWHLTLLHHVMGCVIGLACLVDGE